MAALGAAAGLCYDLLGRLRRGRLTAGAADLFLGALCAAGMTGIALRLRMNPFRLYVFAGVAHCQPPCRALACANAPLIRPDVVYAALAASKRPRAQRQPAADDIQRMHKHPARRRMAHPDRPPLQQRVAPCRTVFTQDRRVANQHRPNRVAQQPPRRAQQRRLQDARLHPLARPPADFPRLVHPSAAPIDRRVRHRQQQRHARLAHLPRQRERRLQPLGQAPPRHLSRQNRRAHPPRRQRAAERLRVRPVADAHRSCADFIQNRNQKRAQAASIPHDQHTLAAPSLEHRLQHRASPPVPPILWRPTRE